MIEAIAVIRGEFVRDAIGNHHIEYKLFERYSKQEYSGNLSRSCLLEVHDSEAYRHQVGDVVVLGPYRVRVVDKNIARRALIAVPTSLYGLWHFVYLRFLINA